MPTIHLKGPGLNEYFAKKLIKSHGQDGARARSCGEMLAAVEREIARANATLLQKHSDFLAKWKARGMPTHVYRTPCCKSEMEDRAAPPGCVWDTLSTCPYCGALYMKVTTDTEITGYIPQAGEKQ